MREYCVVMMPRAEVDRDTIPSRNRARFSITLGSSSRPRAEHVKRVPRFIGERR